MSKNEGSGSIILKILIAVLIVVMYFVITTPGKIWDQERNHMSIAHDNMMGLYEGEKFYHKLTDNYTTDPQELLSVLRGDSLLIKKQAVVNYTNQLNSEVKAYLDNSLTKNLLKVYKNIANIIEDLDNKNNRRHFKLDEQLSNSAEQFKVRLIEYNNDEQLASYISVSLYLDSLRQIRRDLSDFTLQMAAQKSARYTDSLRNFLSKVEVSKMAQGWRPVSTDLKPFVKKVIFSDISKQTSVADRIRDFAGKIDDAFVELERIEISAAISQTDAHNTKIHELYSTFLSDFVITSKYSEMRLSKTDSLLLHLTEDNFYSPVNGEMYKIIISSDSSSVRIESPVLLAAVKEKMTPLVGAVNSMPILESFKSYRDSLESVKGKGYTIRKQIRKNTDIFIQYKELEELVRQYDDISVYSAYANLNSFVEAVNCESYSTIKTKVEEALTGIRIYRQAYEESFYGNLDSLHLDVKSALTDYNELLASVRRLPRGIVPFEAEIAMLDGQLNSIKSINSPQLIEKIKNIETDLGSLLQFVSEGSQEPVYSVFSTDIINPGYIDISGRSWEEGN